MSNFIFNYRRHIAAFFLLNILVELVSPVTALALTSGPSQPEVQEFQAINVSDMVDPSTGDFSYNLPLFDIDGYPVNLSYRAGVTMDQEATFVGLGWNMNVGSISRNMRGIPDDFNGDEIVKKMNMADNLSYGINLGIGGEILGLDALNPNVGFGLSYNSYSGYDFVQTIGLSISLGSHSAVGLGLTSSGDGLTIAPNLSFQAKMAKSDYGSLKGSATLGTSYNSRTGMKEVSLSASLSYENNGEKEKAAKNGNPAPKANDQDKEQAAPASTVGVTGEESHQNFGEINRGSSINFCSPTYVPQITMPMHTNSIMGSFKLGGTIFGLDATADIAGNFSRQKLISKEASFPAYGYLNLHNGQGTENVMLDFNREKDGNFTEATTNLPIPNLTYDNFVVMGQGVGGQFRPFRGEVGYVFDPRASNTSESNSLGVELKLGNLVQGGFDFVNTRADGTSGKWSDENDAVNFMGFSPGTSSYEASYFKEMGEMNVDDDPLYDNIKNEAAARFQLSDRGNSTGISYNMITEGSTVFNIAGKYQRSKRVRRNQLFSTLSVTDYEHFALQTSLFSSIAIQNPDGSLANGHHIGQITTTKTDGTRFVYGLPVYNTQQKEVSFNVSGFSGSQCDTSNNMVLYGSGIDDSENNSKGTDHFFSSTETPPYAYAYLLTAVLSSDYVDQTGDGPTPDDLGTYTLFEYNTTVSNYEWRSPQSGKSGSTLGVANYATLDPGLLTDVNDNKASYVYGKKNLRYLSAIKSKNYIALLNYSSRSDGIGSYGTAGGTNPLTPLQQKLDLITLYAMSDYQANSTNAFKVKQVHFNYNYELCKNVYNFSGSTSLGTGKLTLKSVYFTYGNSNKGVLSPYKFNYNLNVNSSQVSYNPSQIDRWGYYKPSSATCPNNRFPYVEQNKTLEDQYVSLWNLQSIQLPSGGLMEINYESDDYAYVQNKRACEMFKVVGCASTPNPSGFVNANQLFSPGTNYTYLFFQLKQGMAFSPSTFLNDYLGEVGDYLYFRFYMRVNNSSDISNLNFGYGGYEFVHGYAEIDRSAQNNQQIAGTLTLNSINYGYVKVKEVRQSKSKPTTMENPISKAAWQLARTQTPKQAYGIIGGTDPAANANDVEAVIKAIANASFIKNTIQTFQGYNGSLKALSLGQTFRPELSWIRLNSPNYFKLGGGLRVKTVKIWDKWDQMTTSGTAYNSSQNFSYGQQYSYGVTENSRYISSGVASYEPSFGTDENPFRQPVFMDQHKYEALLAPDNDMYVEEPMGESFFPSPVVIYSHVEVTGLTAGAGKTVNEYYTSRDFPTKVHALGMEAKRKKPNPIIQLFSFTAYDRFTGSQGYSIELNDMAGKPKANYVYEEGMPQPLNSTHYYYKHNGNELVNSAKVISKSGAIQDTRMGIDYDFYADFRENNSTTEAIGVKGNLYTMMIGIIPILVVPMLPSYHREDIQLRTAVTNKVVYRYGILESVETRRGSESAFTNNLLWDAETGQVLLTSVTTEFSDSLYRMAYPGHWAYETLAGGYKNTGMEIGNPSSLVNSAGQITDPYYLSVLYPGDELAIIRSGNACSRGYVDKIGSNYVFTENSVLVSTQSSTTLDQNALSSIKTIKVLRSGRHNLQDQKVAGISCFKNPLYNSPASWPVMNETYNITSATAIELGNIWQGYCGCGFMPWNNTSPTSYINQYVYGIKGNPRKTKDYTYLTNRKQTKLQGNSNIRVDGTFEKFTPFWTPNAGNDWIPNPNNWSWMTIATRNSPYGFELESQDALGRYSAAQYGYNQSLPVAVTSNSKFKMSAFENFEYSDLNVCQDDHFGFNQYAANTFTPPASGIHVQKFSHTGKRSIKVAPTATIMVSKQINPCQN